MKTARRPILRAPSRLLAFACMGWVAVPHASIARDNELAIRTGQEIGVTVSSYKYDEPSIMSIKANKIGIDYTGTYALRPDWPERSSGWFLRGDLRYASGKGDYDSPTSGSINDRPDWYYEIRGLFGKEYEWDDHTLAPYVGLGYRYLFNDLRGVTSTGNRGYRRESNYYTLPIGIVHRTLLSSSNRLTTTFEYSPLLRGRQVSKLSDSTATLPDISNTQRHGHGLRIGMMLDIGPWSIGPSFVLWRIKDSDPKTLPTRVVAEPANDTYELGIKGAFRF